jgi:hypothetical protein
VYLCLLSRCWAFCCLVSVMSQGLLAWLRCVLWRWLRVVLCGRFPMLAPVLLCFPSVPLDNIIYNSYDIKSHILSIAMVVQIEQTTECAPSPDNKTAEWDDPAPTHVTRNDLSYSPISFMQRFACTCASGRGTACGHGWHPTTPLKDDSTASHAPPDTHNACLVFTRRGELDPPVECCLQLAEHVPRLLSLCSHDQLTLAKPSFTPSKQGLANQVVAITAVSPCAYHLNLQSFTNRLHCSSVNPTGTTQPRVVSRKVHMAGIGERAACFKMP